MLGGKESYQQLLETNITVKIPCERNLRKFAGPKDDKAIEHWIVDSERANRWTARVGGSQFLFLVVPLRMCCKRGSAPTDLASAYNQVEVDPGYRHKAAFDTPLGLFEHNECQVAWLMLPLPSRDSCNTSSGRTCCRSWLFTSLHSVRMSRNTSGTWNWYCMNWYFRN